MCRHRLASNARCASASAHGARPRRRHAIKPSISAAVANIHGQSVATTCRPQRAETRA